MREFSRMSLAWSAGPRNHSKSTVLRTNRYSQECKKSAQELLIESKGQCFDLSTSRNSQSIERPGRLPTASTSSCLLPPSHTNLSHCHIPTFCMPTYHILTCHHIPTSHANLLHTNLSSHTDFSHANLSDTNLSSHTDFSHANLSHTNLSSHTDFSHANLSHTNLSSHTDFSHANLSHTNLSSHGGRSQMQV